MPTATCCATAARSCPSAVSSAICACVSLAVPCPRGTVAVNRTCLACPTGTYADQMGGTQCSACPENTHTLHEGATDASECLAVCGHGTVSSTGLIPCTPCARNTYSGPPIAGGFRACEPCPANTFTINVGSTSPSQCLQPCAPGTFSTTGLSPCSECPINHYQPSAGQQRCIECANTTFTAVTGVITAAECLPVNCSTVQCANSGVCTVTNHKLECRCKPGFTGALCEQDVDECATQPCYNGASCANKEGGFECRCPTSELYTLLSHCSFANRLHRSALPIRAQRVHRRSVSQRRRVPRSAGHRQHALSVPHRLHGRRLWRDR